MRGNIITDFELLKTNLESRRFKYFYLKMKKEAAKCLNENIDKTTAGMGDSETLNQIGIYDLLKTHNDVYWHWKSTDDIDVSKARSLAMNTEVYLTSANAISLDGDIINIDGFENRAGSMCFGHKQVYFVVGKNKIAENYEKALYRVQNIATPKNAQRLKKNTPCAIKADKCYHCNRPESFCKGLLVLNQTLNSSNFTVILIDEELEY